VSLHEGNLENERTFHLGDSWTFPSPNLPKGGLKGSTQVYVGGFYVPNTILKYSGGQNGEISLPSWAPNVSQK
jgi:hypothetical protein